MNEYPASESNNVLEQISELNRQFRKQIAKGETPKVEAFSIATTHHAG